jgi:CRP/FNR family transcriptional regulator, cyclic AMP receptor protein
MTTQFDELKNSELRNFKDVISREMADDAILQIKTKKIPKKTVVFFQGDENDKLFEIIEGNVKLSKFTVDGKEIIIEILKEGDLFGYISLMDGETCECTATTLTDITVNTVSFQNLPELLEKLPDTSNYLLLNSIKRLRRAYVQIENIVSSSVHKRIARILLEMARQEGQYDSNILTFKIRLTHQELGNLAGTSRETVTRVLTQLKNDGFIKVARSNVSILRENDMETIC